MDPRYHIPGAYINHYDPDKPQTGPGQYGMPLPLEPPKKKSSACVLAITAMFSPHCSRRGRQCRRKGDYRSERHKDSGTRHGGENGQRTTHETCLTHGVCRIETRSGRPPFDGACCEAPTLQLPSAARSITSP